MCGVVGIYNLNGKEIENELLGKMTSAIAHRGPQNQGFFVGGSGGLGYRRLTIIDTVEQEQPILHNEENTLLISFNGEIYNYQLLRDEMMAKGHRFYTKTDTETILHLFEEEGIAAVKRLNGIFAFVIWDKKNDCLWLARDHLGVKPLYYTIVGGVFLAASEIKAILQADFVKREVDPQALNYYLSLRYVPAPLTMFKGIYKLLPGHWMKVGQGGIEIEQYWDVNFKRSRVNDQKNEEDLVKEIKERLNQSVQMQLISDVPLGAFLSGGIDSTILVGLMSKLASEPVKTFSIAFPQYPQYDESEYAKIASQKFGTDHQQIDFSSEDIKLLPRVIYHLDEPLADPAAIPTFVLSQFASEKVRVVLTGEGSDELFRGYERDMPASSKFNPPAGGQSSKLQLKAQSLLLDNLRRLLAELLGYSPNFKGRRRLENFINPDTALVDQVLVALRNDGLLAERWQGQAGESLASFLYPYLSNSSNWDQLSRALYLETKVWLDEPLMKVDKMTMANSLEARVPFLNYELVELLASIPSEIKLGNGVSKYLLRKAMADVLPPEIQQREKQGFELPLEQWFRNELKPLVDQELSYEAIERTGYLDHHRIAEMLKRHQRGEENYKYEIFSLLCFQLWHKIFIQGENWENLII